MRVVPLVLALIAGAAGTVAAQPSGEAYLNGAVSRQTSPVGNGTLGGFTLGFGFGSPKVTVGPEMIFQGGDSLRVRGFALAGRIRQGGSWIHPHLVVGLGAYAWQRRVGLDSSGTSGGPIRPWREVTYLSGSLGAGVTIGRWRGRLTGMVEGRFHRNLSQTRAEGSRSLVGVEAGLRVSW